jgi:hypothetical protein
MDDTARNRKWLIALIAAVVFIRAAFMLVMPQPVVSDFLSYFEMARTFAVGGPMRDIYGSQAFYSPGYPLLIGSVFALTGPSVGVALAVNLGLSAVTAWLVFRLAQTVTKDGVVPFVAVAAYAVWLPGVVASASLAKENLSVPLLIGLLLSVLAVARGDGVARASIIVGICFGAGLLAGASTLLVIATFLFALWQCWKSGGVRKAAVAGGGFAMAAALMLGPWLSHTYQLFGKPVLTTNSGFNLYIGNNPAATGSFVSIADTPVGPEWHDMRARLGESGSADALRHMAVQYALSNPGRTAELAAIKLTRFWMPNVPSTDGDLSSANVLGRWLDALQHILLMTLGVFGVWTLHRHAQAIVFGVTICSFWAIHAAAVVMYRYRDPIMPIVIVFAAVGFVALFRRKAPQ